jgi:hypothetical protein
MFDVSRSLTLVTESVTFETACQTKATRFEMINFHSFFVYDTESLTFMILSVSRSVIKPSTTFLIVLQVQSLFFPFFVSRAYKTCFNACCVAKYEG